MPRPRETVHLRGRSKVKGRQPTPLPRGTRIRFRLFEPPPRARRTTHEHTGVEFRLSAVQAMQ